MFIRKCERLPIVHMITNLRGNRLYSKRDGLQSQNTISRFPQRLACHNNGCT